ncbi:hypothetical protein L6164_028516 [Bauhinia variegata]|uniref:Uncharacterized protein n=1 Tax=Bauhinia variegata TaxID=167791 RepID=A0ACB9L6F5_BAUVA|nr:hypothetical protein L6164_028516 [Bauhinia variegata]
MTYMGWAVKNSSGKGKHEYLGSPDVMVVVIPHLVFVVLPAVLVAGALTAERAIYQEHMFPLSGKKNDDYDLKLKGKRSLSNSKQSGKLLSFLSMERRIRKVLCVICLAVCWKHSMNCRILMKAYEMNPFIHFLGYGLSIPYLLAFAMYETRSR